MFMYGSGGGIRGVLANATLYRLFGLLIGASRRFYVTLLDQYVGIRPGQRVLDIGCGPGTIVPYLPKVEYFGFDASEKYINAARKRYANRGSFTCQRIDERSLENASFFDLAFAFGMLHHLSDSEALQLFLLADNALKQGGRLITLDGCYIDGQSQFAKWLISRDRGRHVRTNGGYSDLARQVFSDVRVHVRHDMLRIPYTHVILVCTKA